MGRRRAFCPEDASGRPYRSFATVKLFPHRSAAAVANTTLRGMRSRFSSAAIMALLLSGCASVESSSGPTAADPGAISSISESPGMTPPPTPLPPSIASPSAVVMPEATPMPFGADVFTDADDCTNPAAGYRVAYPDHWYSNAAVPNPLGAADGVPACIAFAPTDFSVVYGTEPSPAIAITIAVFELPDGVPEYNYGPFEGYAVLSDSAAAVGGHPARILEVEVTQPSVGFTQLGDRYTEYVVELPGRRFLNARTRSQDDYATSRQVLSEMMQTLEVLSP